MAKIGSKNGLFSKKHSNEGGNSAFFHPLSQSGRLRPRTLIENIECRSVPSMRTRIVTQWWRNRVCHRLRMTRIRGCHRLRSPMHSVNVSITKSRGARQKSGRKTEFFQKTLERGEIIMYRTASPLALVGFVSDFSGKGAARVGGADYHSAIATIRVVRGWPSRLAACSMAAAYSSASARASNVARYCHWAVFGRDSIS